MRKTITDEELVLLTYKCLHEEAEEVRKSLKKALKANVEYARKIRETYIELYVKQLKEKHNLTDEQVKKIIERYSIKKTNLMDSKLTGNIHDDVDKVYDAVGYVEALVDGLMEEEISQNNKNQKRTALFIELMELQKLMKQAMTKVTRVRHEEEKYTFGPLAGRNDLG